MKEKYPFFRDENEQSQAIIGESAIESDLQSHFEKPYAVLTQKRLYCKNEMGNFIVETEQLHSAGVIGATAASKLSQAVSFIAALATALLIYFFVSISGKNRDQSGKIIPLLFVMALLGLSLVFMKKRPKMALALLAVHSLLLFLCSASY